jgi:hypothetical protein
MSNSLINLIPAPLDSDRQYERFYHFDITGLDDTQLIDELDALRPFLWWKLPDNDWLQERVRLLKGESRKRGLTWR